MINVATAAIPAPSVYQHLSRDEVSVLEQLLCAVPAARQQFEEGKVPEAMRLLAAAERVRLNPKVGVTKGAFLALVDIKLPNRYSV